MTKGSRNESPWLAFANVTSYQKVTEIPNEIPLKHEVFFASFLAPRSEKVRQAQDDIQIFHFVVCVRKRK